MVSLFGVCRCILYPGTKIIAASYTFKQGKEIVLKITDDFMQKSSFLRNEIESTRVGQNDCVVYFKNGSFIRVVTATESSRGSRANILIVDESRLVQQKIVDTILRPMNSAPRQPGYLYKPEYAHLKEMNKEIYMSSAFYAASEMFEKVKSYAANMLDPTLKYFVCDLNYGLSIKEGLLMREQIINEQSESTFNDITFGMERLGLFYGSADDALYDYNVLSKRRILKIGLQPLDFYRENNLRVPEKQTGELRILSVDVALLASKKHDNDASALMVHSAIPTTSNNYIDNVLYVETQEGLTSEELGLIVMRSYYQYYCDYIALDMAGIGQAVADYLMSDRYDPLYNETYGALNVCNAPELQDRCKIKGAPKVIYSIKANQKFNNDASLLLRSGFQNGHINLLISGMDCEEEISHIRGYGKQTDQIKSLMALPYVQTDFTINELINLTHEVTNGMIKVKEKYGMRKDRYSSLMYGYYVVQELSKNLKPKNVESDIIKMLAIRPAKRCC